jgi:1-deoxy-D-xylulose-5-phosphate reductoisomerase
MKKRVAVLGATGSIGKSALDVIRRNTDDFEVILLSARGDGEGLAKLGGEWPGAARVLAGGEGGKEQLLAAIAEAGADITVNGIAGAAGLEPSLAALDSGSSLALANKETVVMAGPLVFKRAVEKNAAIIPVDSEHSAIFHLLAAHNGGAVVANAAAEGVVSELLLTASGGPFRTWPLERMRTADPAAALAHPTWNMGPKITIDSASMANKGLEVIEAALLFNMPPEKIKVVIHPQSVVHSMIRLCSGEVYAQLSRPDMRHPIHAALYWPDTKPSAFAPLDFDSLTLEFAKPDYTRFPMLNLAYQAARQGGLYPCAYNAANEEAAASFLNRRAGFLDIGPITEYVLSGDWDRSGLTIESVLEADERARLSARSYINRITG